jgi:Domain of unknown function (DUF4226)
MAMPDDVPAADHQEGDAADAIRSAEVALAHQNSTTAQVDLQVVTAVLNAHRKAAASRDALNVLQRDIESAVATRSDLDTPAGARDFQRYLIGKLRDIQAVVAGASLDDTSNSALMAAWTALYNSSQAGPDVSDAPHQPAAAPAPAPTQPAARSQPPPTESVLDPYGDSLPEDDLGLPTEEAPGQSSSPASTPAAMPSIPSFGGGGLPSGGGLGLPAGLPLGDSLPEERSPFERDDARPEDPENRLVSDDDDHAPAGDESGEPGSGPTTVTLPNGETLTAASPQLAAAIEAAASGTPIAEAFRQQGMTIPPPGTTVSDPVDPSQLTPGDIGMFTDRHALALGESRALVNGQIQHISTVSGPGFLGWEHPPAPVNASPPPASDPPAPTRPATAERTETA